MPPPKPEQLLPPKQHGDSTAVPDPVGGQLEVLLHQQEQRLKLHFDQAIQRLVRSNAAAGVDSLGGDVKFSMGKDTQLPSSIGLKAGMPPHLVQLIERIRRGGDTDRQRRNSTGGFGTTWTWQQTWRQIRKKAGRTKALRKIGVAYEYFVDLLVLAYALTLGFEVHYTTRAKQQPDWVYSVELAFCIIFGLDIVLRVAVERCGFFNGRRRWWNLLDVVCVAMMSAALVQESRTLENLSSSLRIMRLIRLVRVLWALRSTLAQWTQLRGLRILLTSLGESVKVMAWMGILVFSGVYVASLIMTEGVWRECPNPETELLCQKFGTLFDSMITFFQIQFSGMLWGQLWDEVQSLEWIFQVAFLSYVGFALLILANTITSFVCSLQSNVTKRERELLIDSHLDFNERLVRQLYAIFRDFDQNGNGAVSWTEFQLALQDERMQAFLSALELDMSDAVKVFQILASDSTGAIEESDFLLGCLRLRGGATAVDMVRIQMEQEWMHSALQQTRAMTQKILHFLASDLRANGPGNENARSLHAQSIEIDSDSESSEDPIHNFQRTALQTWQRAVTLQELRTLLHDTSKLCHGWQDNVTGNRILPSELNLYQFSYNYILPKTAPKEGIQLRIPWRSGGGEELQKRIPLPGQEVHQMQNAFCLPRASALILSASADAAAEVLDVWVEMKQGRFTVGDGELFLGEDAWAPAPVQVQCQNSISYKELLSSSACVPEWYCSHWWGEPILSFVRCCQHQASVRHLSDQNARYWVCGYANRQHELDLEITEDVSQSSFYSALRNSAGLLLILDQDATPFSRIWCDFELYTAIMNPTMGLDIVTYLPSSKGSDQVRLLSKNLIPGESAVAKSVREQNFPLVLLDKGLEVVLEDGDATHVEDKRAILRSIAASREMISSEGKERLVTNLERANQTLHSTLAILTWPQAMHKGLLTKGERKLNVCQALSSDVSRESVELSLAHFGQSCVDAAVRVLAESFPPNLVKLKLSFEGCTRLTDVSLRTLASSLSPLLKNLYLDFVGCENLTDAGLQVLASSLPAGLEELELHFAGCERLYSPGIRALHDFLPSNLRIFKATFRGTGVNQNFANRAELRSFVQILDN